MRSLAGVSTRHMGFKAAVRVAGALGDHHRAIAELVDFRLHRGDEMGRFNLGSTVILVTGENFELGSGIAAGATVRMGRSIGRASGIS